MSVLKLKQEIESAVTIKNTKGFYPPENKKAVIQAYNKIKKDKIKILSEIRNDSDIIKSNWSNVTSLQFSLYSWCRKSKETNNFSECLAMSFKSKVKINKKDDNDKDNDKIIKWLKVNYPEILKEFLTKEIDLDKVISKEVDKIFSNI